MGTIERLLKANPDLRKEAIVKMEALRLGTQIGGDVESAAMSRAWGSQWFTFSMDFAESRTAKPMYFTFPGGTVCEYRHNPQSPYSIELAGDRYILCEAGEKIIDVDFPPAHALYHRSLSDGTPLRAIVDKLYGSGDVMGACFCVLNVCFWKIEERCRFCDMVSHTAAQTKKNINFIVHKKQEQVAEAWELCRKEANVRYINLTGGTILGEYQGKTETQFYMEYLEAMARRAEWPDNYGIAITGGKSKDDLKRIRDTGIKIIGMNLEVWDPTLFAAICPGKNRLVGRDRWIQSLIDAVEVFGPGNVVSNFVAGVEMAQPLGFETAEAALESTLGGYEYLIQRGIVPRQDYWCPAHGSMYHGQRRPPSEFYIGLSRGCWHLLKKYGLPPSPFFRKECCMVDPIHDLYEAN